MTWHGGGVVCGGGVRAKAKPVFVCPHCRYGRVQLAVREPTWRGGGGVRLAAVRVRSGTQVC